MVRPLRIVTLRLGKVPWICSESMIQPPWRWRMQRKDLMQDLLQDSGSGMWQDMDVEWNAIESLSVDEPMLDWSIGLGNSGQQTQSKISGIGCEKEPSLLKLSFHAVPVPTRNLDC